MKFLWEVFFGTVGKKLFLGKGRRHNLSSLVASPAATAQISGTLSVANTLIKCTPSGQYTDIEQFCTVASIVY